MGRKRQVEISDKQEEVLAYLIQHIVKFGYQPNQKELAEHFQVQRKAMTDRLEQLQQKGYITLPGANRERCIIIHGVKFSASEDEDFDAPQNSPL